MSRMERWKPPKYLASVYSGNNKDRLNVLSEWLKSSPKDGDKSSRLTSYAIIEASQPKGSESFSFPVLFLNVSDPFGGSSPNEKNMFG